MRGGTGLRWWLAAVATAVAAGPFLGGSALSTAVSALMFVTLAQSWNLIGGLAGYPSFGHVAFFGVGGYAAAVLTVRTGMSFWAALPLAGAGAALVAALIGPPLLRLRGNAFTAATLGVAAGAQELVSNLAVTGGGAGLTFPTFGPGPHTAYPANRSFYWLFLLLAVASVSLVAAVSSSRYGLALAALRSDETAAAAAGVPTTRIKVSVFVLSAALAGLAGALWAFEQVVIFPSSMFDLTTTVLMVVMVVVGGRATVSGPVVGAILLETLVTELQPMAAHLEPLLLPALIVIAVLVLPDGVLGASATRLSLRAVRDAVRRYRL